MQKLIKIFLSYTVICSMSLVYANDPVIIEKSNFFIFCKAFVEF